MSLTERNVYQVSCNTCGCDLDVDYDYQPLYDSPIEAMNRAIDAGWYVSDDFTVFLCQDDQTKIREGAEQ